MSAAIDNQLVDCVVPLNMNGLRGRMLRLPPPPRKKKREILFVYGQQGSLERWWGLLKALNRYGGVTATDLPGFGGMESLRKLGRKPNIDTLADYLAAFIKLRFKRRRMVIVGERFGFVVVTRMLQRYPNIANNVDLAVSFGGFAHHDDLVLGDFSRFYYRLVAWFFSWRLPAWWLGHVWFWPAAASRMNFDAKKIKTNRQATTQLVAMRLEAAHQNDVRTVMAVTKAMLKLDNCRQQLPLPLWQVIWRGDSYLNSQVTEQHLKVTFSEVRFSTISIDASNPLLTCNPKTAPDLLPVELRSVLAKLGH